MVIDSRIYDFLSPTEIAKSKGVNPATRSIAIHLLDKQLHDFTCISVEQICEYRNALGLLRDREPSALLTPADLNAVLNRCVNVTHLDLRELTPPSLVQVLTAPLPAVRSIDLAMRDSELRGINFVEFITRHTELISLDLSFCYRLTDSSIAALAGYCRKITSLKLHNCWGIKGTCLAALAKHCSRLTSLDLSNAGLKDDALVDSPAEGFSALTSLQLRNILLTNAGCIKLVKRCPNLTSLAVGFGPGHPGRSDGVFAGIGAVCPKLTSLDLCYYVGTGTTLDAVAAAFRNLTFLDLGRSSKNRITYTPEAIAKFRVDHLNTRLIYEIVP